MKIIILAAGQGKRLLPLTKDIPKCLISIKDKTLIEHSLDRIAKTEIKDVIVIVGHHKEKVIRKLGTNYKSLKIKYIENEIYMNTDCIYSLWLAKEEAKDGFIVLNSDTLFDQNILINLINSKYKNAAVIDDMKIRIDEDSMKTTIKDCLVRNIAKDIFFENADGHAIGIYKFSKEGAVAYFKEIESMVKKGITNVHHMVPMNEFVKTNELYVVSTNGLGWIEIDTPLDLRNAEIVMELIEQEEENIRFVEESFKRVSIKEILARRSVRFFTEKDFIAKKDIMTILEAARWAPSAKNLQPLEYIIVDDQKIKEKLAIYCQQIQPKVVPVCIVVIGDLEVSGMVGQISTHSTTTKERALRMFIYMDAAAAIENMLLTATSLGMDSLWISSFQDEKIAELFNLSNRYEPLAVICLGHRTEPPFNPPKRDLRERIYFNKFEERNKDFSYLQICKQINEEDGEYKGKEGWRRG